MLGNERHDLTVDVGNSFIKMAVFQGDDVISFIRQDQLEAEDLIHLIEKYKIQGISYSASGDDNPEVISFLKKHDKTVFLEHDTPMPIEIMYETPHTLGRDRIAAVLGAQHMFPKENVLVIDFGTCVTMEVLTKEGHYLGGNISPGAQMRLDAMHHFTDRLPLVEINGDDDFIGRSTESAIRNGAVLGTILEVESFISRAKERFGDCEVVFTGGGAKYLIDKFEHTIHHEPMLLHRGLHEILKYNEENK